MKTALLPVLICAALGLQAATARAQACPYTTTFTPYGSACSTVALQLPSLIGPFVPGGSDCSETVLWDVPIVCCNVILTDRWLVVGIAPASLPLPGGGCTLLATPDVIIALPALEGGLALTFLLPPLPSLIGASLYVQGVDRRVVTIGGSTHIETSNGLQMTFM